MMVPYQVRITYLSDSEDPGFSTEERITKNFLKSSISPHGKMLVGMFALIPSVWRGPIIIVVCGVIGYLTAHFGPPFIDWLRQ